MSQPMTHSEHGRSAFGKFAPLGGPGISVVSRRSVLKAGLAGMAGLSLPDLLQSRSQAAAGALRRPKSVILLWMAGGPSHIDLWDMKPEAPREIRGPFSPIATSLPGTFICEHLPKQAAMMHKFTLLRSVDSSASGHQPNVVFQTGNLAAEPRVNPEAPRYPAIASAIAKFRGANRPGLPPYVACTADRTHIAWGGYLGQQYDPFLGATATLPHEKPFSALSTMQSNPLSVGASVDKFQLSAGLTQDRLQHRVGLRKELDRLRSDLDLAGSMAALDGFSQQAMEMIAGRRAAEAFDLSSEPAAVHERYGRHPWCQQGLLARRLVEAGVSFVTISLSPYRASGAWDTHGDKVVYFGIEKGLKPLLPPFDHLITTLVQDLEERRMLDDTLVLIMGEFGRTPQMSDDGGRNHWPNVMSMCVAGGGFDHGRVIGSTDRRGGEIHERPIRPGDLAATIYRHMEVPLDITYVDHAGRPRYFVEHGELIPELS